MSNEVPEGFRPDGALPEKPEAPKVVLECDECDWQYLSDGSIPDADLVEVMEDHMERLHS